MGQLSGVGVLDKSVAVLDAAAHAPVGLGDLVELTGLPRATAHRLAVARGRPVRLTSSASVAGSSATARRMATALSKTATGLGCPTQQYSHLIQ